MIIRITAALAMSLALGACSSVEVAVGQAYGDIRVEPHPSYADSVRITTRIPTVGPDPLLRTQGPDTMVPAVLGEKCRGAKAAEEGRTVGLWDRTDITYRVVCPAARGGSRS